MELLFHETGNSCFLFVFECFLSFLFPLATSCFTSKETYHMSKETYHMSKETIQRQRGPTHHRQVAMMSRLPKFVNRVCPNIRQIVG